MIFIKANLEGGSLDGLNVVMRAIYPPLLLRLKSFAGREVVYKIVDHIEVSTWRYEFFSYWDGKIELVEETPDN